MNNPQNMDVVKTPVWKQIIESLANELGIQIRVGEKIYGQNSRYLELRMINEQDPYENIQGIHFEKHSLEHIPIIAGPFKTEKQPKLGEKLAEAQKHLPEWNEHKAKTIKLGIQHAMIASHHLMQRRKTPDNERMLFSYWQQVRKAQNTKEAMQHTVQFLVNQFRVGNVSIILQNERVDHFAINQAMQKAERIIFSQIHNTKTACTINTQADFLLQDLTDKEQLPSKITAIPLVKSRQFLGAVFMYGDNSPILSQVIKVLDEFLESLSRAATFEQVKESAVTDKLTGLHNRSVIETKLRDMLQNLSAQEKPTSVLMIDADNFKSFNDTYGHPEGDKLLQSIAHMIKSQIPENAIACRYGGEEFLIALPEMNQHDAKSFAENLRQTVQQQCPRTISIGMITCLNSSGNPEKLIKEADEALYRAKHLGQNKVVQKIMIDKHLGIIDA